ncbi:MAG: hypothetical protein JXP34_00140, partial [Planctomycetes bacterium]|nr:hypothetical protein [Planctomycetota bacterium]
MVTTSSILLVAGLACSATNAEDAPVVERTHRSCFLSEQADGSVWIEDLFLPWLYDTTYGRRLLTMPGIRLGADPARDLAPLVARIEERTEARPLPRPRDGKSPLFVLQLETRMRGEVISARVVQAEVLPAGWTLAQEALEAALEEIVAASLTPPGEEKARRVREAIVAGSRALDRMEAMDASPEAIAIVKQVEPRAAIVRTLRDEVERIVGGRLRQYAARLRIVPEGLARGEVANEKGEGRPAMRAAIREWGVEVSEASEDVLAEKL